MVVATATAKASDSTPSVAARLVAMAVLGAAAAAAEIRSGVTIFSSVSRVRAALTTTTLVSTCAAMAKSSVAVETGVAVGDLATPPAYSSMSPPLKTTFSRSQCDAREIMKESKSGRTVASDVRA